MKNSAGKIAGSVIKLLQKRQSEKGWISRDDIRSIASGTGSSEAQVYGTATFYSSFRLKPKGEHLVSVCQGTACHVKGSGEILDHVKRTLKIEIGETSSNGKFTLQRVACLGCCSLAPVMMIDDKIYGHLTPQKAGKILSSLLKLPVISHPKKTLPTINHQLSTKFYVGIASCGIAAGGELIFNRLIEHGIHPEKTGCRGNC